ncbi:DedA family protein [Streptomyces sp. NPDC001621]|uniref:DedA family protein n=1 Tax=Streptomyces sp. NPDC001621 TaxID=3364594 RepID=UPI0036821AC7
MIEAAGWWSYGVVFAVTAGETSAFVGLLLPGETIILLASAIAARGDLNPLVLAAVIVAGGITGDSLGYALGHWYGRRPSKWGRRIRTGSRIGRTRGFLTRHGGAAVFTGRFIGVIRTFLPFAAGASGMPYRRFFLYSTAASLVWGVGNVLLGYFAGAAATEFLHSVGLIAAAALAGASAAVLVVVRILTGRRRLVRATSLAVASGGDGPSSRNR